MPLTKKDTEAIWADVEKNMKLLNSCEGIHDFQTPNTGRVLGAKFCCTKCGGTVGAVDKHYYYVGVLSALKAARKAIVDAFDADQDVAAIDVIRELHKQYAKKHEKKA